MSNNRDSLITKIQALMAKTVENGCTEEEAFAALDKARALMDAYEVSDDELKLSKEEQAVLRSEPKGTQDPNGIKSGLAKAVADFTECRVWYSHKGEKGLTFCGMQSDARFATWLLDYLTIFVQGELANHLTGKGYYGTRERNNIKGSFVAGCTSRISERLRSLIKHSEQVVTGNSRALVVVKKQAVAAKMEAANIHLGRSRSSTKFITDSSSYHAGRAAGNNASFGRPVSGSNATLRLSHS
jgi:hypothetical protein